MKKNLPKAIAFSLLGPVLMPSDASAAVWICVDNGACFYLAGDWTLEFCNEVTAGSTAVCFPGLAVANPDNSVSLAGARLPVATLNTAQKRELMSIAKDRKASDRLGRLQRVLLQVKSAGVNR